MSETMEAIYSTKITDSCGAMNENSRPEGDVNVCRELNR